MSIFSGPGSLYTKRLVFTGIGALALIAAQPFLWGAVSSSATALHAKRTEEEQYQNMVQRLSSIEESLRVSSGMYDQLSISFPGLNATPQILDRLEQAAVANQVDLNVRGIREREPLYSQGAIRLVPMVITIEVEGLTERVLAYFDTILHVSELTYVDSWVLDLTRGGEGLRLSASVSFYLTNFGDEQ